jgi:GT2 family glycosyltransferase
LIDTLPAAPSFHRGKTPPMPADAPAADTTTPSRTNAASARLVVERVIDDRVTGWAFDPAAPGAERLALLCGGRRFEPVLQRQMRDDVSRSVGVSGIALGFEFQLPGPEWSAGLPAGLPLQLSLDGAPPVPVGGAHAGGAARAVSGHVEGWRGLAIVGWVGDRPDAREPLRLRCGERLYEVTPRRRSRRDVAQALQLVHDELGVELEVPGTVWRDAGPVEAVTLQVELRGRAIGPALVLARADLPGHLRSALDQPDALQRGPQALLAMEHLAWAGLLGEIDEAARRALTVLATSAGVGAWWQAAQRGPAALAEHLAGERPLRKPFRIAPRGRLGRWLQKPAHGEQALRWLDQLRARPFLAGLARRLEREFTHALGLFDRGTYDAQLPPSQRGVGPALRHYIEHGDARSLLPMGLFDARHYTGQLEGRRHPGINRLLHYGLVGRHRGLSPCAWFEPAYYLETYPDVRATGVEPLTHFVNWGWKERRRPAARFEPTTGSRQSLMQRLAQGGGTLAAPLDPLQQYLLDGLPADAQPADTTQWPWAVPAQLDGRDHLELDPWRSLPRPSAEPRIDVIVPVYAGAQETLRCLWSVLASPVATPFALVVIDDCSPEPALSTFLRELAGLGLIELHVNSQNHGFVASVNKGLKLHWDRDVVILNSDTRVHPGWLDRLAAHGEADPRAASVTPLSNNATVCSYPRMLHSNWERLELDDAALDALAAEANAGRHVEVPTGVGFCMWMRRAALDAVGWLDVERFGRGYGEENDWCMRANAAGWVQLVASDVYVLHQGSVSFRAEASERTRAGVATLLQRHPDYQLRIDEWIARDPLHAERARLDVARLKRAAEVQPGGGLVLMINHGRGGGTARHEAEVAARLREQHGWGAVALRPSRRRGCVALAALGHEAAATLDLPSLQAIPLHDPANERAPGVVLKELLGLLGLHEVQLHHLVDHSPGLRELLPGLCKTLDVPLSVTLHDYHFICPRINLVDASGRYCGEPDRDTCNRCLQREDIGRIDARIGPWRAVHGQLLAQAQRVIVPDLDVASRLTHYFPAVRVQVQPHETLVVPAQRPPRPAALREVLVIGALGVAKGFEVVRGLAGSRAAAQAGLRFTLLGHSPDDAALRGAGVQVLGAYDDAELAGRIEALAPDLILLPSVWPETFCYVLTSAVASGRRVAVFDLGAQARRLKEAKADAVYLPIELAGQPEVLAKLLLGAFEPTPGR